MYIKQTTIVNRTGLHARPATQFVEAAKSFKSRVQITNLSLNEEDNKGNAKSIVSILALGLSRDSRVEISAEGDDEKQAVDSLVELIDGGFGE